MRRQRPTLTKMAYRVLAVFILSNCAALDVMAQPAFKLEPIADGAAFAKRTDLAPGDTLELAVHAENARRLNFRVRRIGSQERYEEIPLPNAFTPEPCYDGTEETLSRTTLRGRGALPVIFGVTGSAAIQATAHGLPPRTATLNAGGTHCDNLSPPPQL